MKALVSLVAFLAAFGFVLAGCTGSDTAPLKATIAAQEQRITQLEATATPTAAPSPTIPPTPTRTPSLTPSPTPVPTLIATASPTPTRIQTRGQVLREVVPSVLRIRVGDGEGTGFVAFQAGQVLTAFHVVG